MIDTVASIGSEIGQSITGNYLAFVSVTLAVVVLIPSYLQVIEDGKVAPGAILGVNIIFTMVLSESIFVAAYCWSTISAISKVLIIAPLCAMGAALVIVWIYYYSRKVLSSLGQD